jgi:hypothetical protein
MYVEVKRHMRVEMEKDTPCKPKQTFSSNVLLLLELVDAELLKRS